MTDCWTCGEVLSCSWNIKLTSDNRDLELSSMPLIRITCIPLNVWRCDNYFRCRTTSSGSSSSTGFSTHSSMHWQRFSASVTVSSTTTGGEYCLPRASLSQWMSWLQQGVVWLGIFVGHCPPMSEVTTWMLLRLSCFTINNFVIDFVKLVFCTVTVRKICLGPKYMSCIG